MAPAIPALLLLTFSLSFSFSAATLSRSAMTRFGFSLLFEKEIRFTSKTPRLSARVPQKRTASRQESCPKQLFLFWLFYLTRMGALPSTWRHGFWRHPIFGNRRSHRSGYGSSSRPDHRTALRRAVHDVVTPSPAFAFATATHGEAPRFPAAMTDTSMFGFIVPPFSATSSGTVLPESALNRRFEYDSRFQERCLIGISIEDVRSLLDKGCKENVSTKNGGRSVGKAPQTGNQERIPS